MFHRISIAALAVSAALMLAMAAGPAVSAHGDESPAPLPSCAPTLPNPPSPSASPGMMDGGHMMSGPSTSPGMMGGGHMMSGPSTSPGMMGGGHMMSGPSSSPGMMGGGDMMGGASPAATAAPAASGEPVTDPCAGAMRIEVTLLDTMRMEPAEITVPAGVPITFVVTNTGAIAHEFTLGDAADQQAHDIEMMQMGGQMMADEPNAIGVPAGATKELTWVFAEPGEMEAGCHVPGHYPAGMKMLIHVEG